jgi:hypothetical protein
MHAPELIMSRCVAVIFFAAVAAGVLASSVAVAAETISPARLSEIVARQADELSRIDSTTGAMASFTTTVGPFLGLKDAAGMLGAKGLPAKLTKELGLAELSQSAHELMASLAAWELADHLRHAGDEPHSATPASTALPAPARQEWMKTNSRVASLVDLFHAMQDQQAADAVPSVSRSPRAALLLAANRVAFEASQRATAAWWNLHGWKERIRQARGFARLCGTWQWIIHNHQNHGEQKLVMVFPPAGQTPATVPLPVETVVLGDSIYLRWEQGGYVQEDSLLFIKDAAKDATIRIEGSFVNNSGGWGSITGKRTAGCQP